MNWTPPYCGVTHATPSTRGIRQLTVVDHETFCVATAFGLTGFKPVFERTFRGALRVEDAKRWLEERAGALGGDASATPR